MKLVDKKFYKTNNDKIRLKLLKLQKLDKNTQKIKIENLDKYKNNYKNCTIMAYCLYQI